MTASLTAHPWSEDALLAKALLYVGRMESHTPDDWEFGFWSALALEVLAGAALAHISPVLLADSKSSWRNLTHALGIEPTTMSFVPTSIGTKEVLVRLNALLPTTFTKELQGFCAQHADRRNSELHSGVTAFVSLGTAGWLPRYYAACKVLLESMDRKLDDLIGDEQAAQAMIDALEDAAAKAVHQDIFTHKKAWEDMDERERATATTQAIAWATRQAGHRVQCPACQSPALIQGSPRGAVTTVVGEEEVVQRQTMLPASLACIACALRISGLSKLSACGLGDAFTAKSTYSVAEFFGLYTEDDMEEARAEYPESEPDFNEY